MTTQKPLKLYAIELAPRDFSLTQFTLDNGHAYSGVRLFDTQKLAQADIDSDVKQAMLEREDLDPGDEDYEDEYKSDDEIRNEMGSVAPLLITADGQVHDAFGQDLSGFIGRSEDQSPSQVSEHLKQLYAHMFERLKKQRSYESSGLGL
ncbi:hypothetical protein [Pseudomonas viridiflava]|uniref:hypothetical protein n=1 Tax=Pseudomonas viridiflava TaxID=33069 RepID=UPI000F03C114|nr:hypothetical protein [Pseudomonas viridiflava]